MGRTKQTARKSSGGSAPRRMIATSSKRGFASFVTSMQSPVYEAGREVRTTYVREDTTMQCYELTPADAVTEDLFSTALSAKVDMHPVTGKREAHFGLNVLSSLDRKLTAETRPVVAIVVALDISGSMSTSFSEESNMGKLDGAKHCLNAVIDSLRADDTLGIILFNHGQEILLEPTRVGEINVPQLRMDIASLRPHGGTNLGDAMDMAMKALDGVPKAAVEGCAAAVAGRGATRRVLYMTDLQTNCNSVHDERRALALAQEGAGAGRYTTVVGIGVDLNKDMVRAFSSLEGGRYMSAARPDELAEATASDFAYDVTIVARNLRIKAHVDGRPGKAPVGGWLSHGFGSPEVEAHAPGGGFAISSEFPTNSRLGGMYLFRLHQSALKGHGAVTGHVSVSWNDSTGARHERKHPFALPLEGEANPFLKKAVALVRFVQTHNDFLKTCEDIRGQRGAKRAAESAIQEMTTFREYFISTLVGSGDFSLSGRNKGDIEMLDKMIEVEAKDADLPVPVLPAPPAAPGVKCKEERGTARHATTRAILAAHKVASLAASALKNAFVTMGAADSGSTATAATAAGVADAPKRRRSNRIQSSRDKRR